MTVVWDWCGVWTTDELRRQKNRDRYASRARGNALRRGTKPKVFRDGITCVDLEYLASPGLFSTWLVILIDKALLFLMFDMFSYDSLSSDSVFSCISGGLCCVSCWAGGRREHISFSLCGGRELSGDFLTFWKPRYLRKGKFCPKCLTHLDWQLLRIVSLFVLKLERTPWFCFGTFSPYGH